MPPVTERRAAGRRWIRRGLVSVACMAALGGSAAAQTVDDIIARHLAARGGAERWQTVRTLRLTGRASAGPGRDALITREIKRPGRVRTEFTFQGITGVFAYDGSRGWQISPLTGIVTPQVMDPDSTQTAIEQADLEGPLVSARRNGAVVALIGQEAVSGRQAFRLRFTPKRGAAVDFFVDTETFLVLKTESTRVVRGHPVQAETSYADYRTVGGLVVAHTIEIGARDRPERLRILVDAVDINPAISNSRFKAPSGTR